MNNGIIILHNLHRNYDENPMVKRHKVIRNYYKLNKCKDSTIWIKKWTGDHFSKKAP
jgi:hypothetical protein